MELVLSNNFVAIPEDKMMYLDGGFSIPRWQLQRLLT